MGVAVAVAMSTRQELAKSLRVGKGKWGYHEDTERLERSVVPWWRFRHRVVARMCHKERNQDPMDEKFAWHGRGRTR